MSSHIHSDMSARKLRLALFPPSLTKTIRLSSKEHSRLDNPSATVGAGCNAAQPGAGAGADPAAAVVWARLAILPSQRLHTGRRQPHPPDAVSARNCGRHSRVRPPSCCVTCRHRKRPNNRTVGCMVDTESSCGHCGQLGQSAAKCHAGAVVADGSRRPGLGCCLCSMSMRC